MEDKNLPKSLADPEQQLARLARLREPHIAPLSWFVEEVRRERGCGSAVPYCDPADGGIKASCLFLLEAPGPKAVSSGFVSRDNPDETAKNFLLLNEAAGIPRACTVTWNIVPWYIGLGGRIRAATTQDIEQGWPYLRRLLALLPCVTAVVLIGRKAQRIRPRLMEICPGLQLVDCPHPSPMFINRRPENRSMVLNALCATAETLQHGLRRPGAA